MRSNDDRVDKSITFQSVNIAVMTVSDTRTTGDDRYCGYSRFVISFSIELRIFELRHFISY